ncbi:MOSC domain-containing protein [Limibacillus sp. MBR-115]|jgi:MOSC domain-containing protein YiiM|uniref:MOSC domain-containing protein n=1 Tax=Limibacillus sp. MBR-115 TaxID=3156465 RepID=UPI0033946A32
MNFKIRSVMVGKISPLGRNRVASGIFKRQVGQPVRVTFSGLVGDHQGDTKHHGGPEKAVHHYAFEHYALWRTENPMLAPHLTNAGAFGENISTEGLTEADVCIGDIFRLGTARVQVSQGRQPCWRLNERFQDSSMARLVQASGRTGWYYRVLEEGQVMVGDSIALIDRQAKNWPLIRILRVLYRNTLNKEYLSELAELDCLADSWRKLARRRIETCVVEDWSQRLNTPSEH